MLTDKNLWRRQRKLGKNYTDVDPGQLLLGRNETKETTSTCICPGYEYIRARQIRAPSTPFAIPAPNAGRGSVGLMPSLLLWTKRTKHCICQWNIVLPQYYGLLHRYTYGQWTAMDIIQSGQEQSRLERRMGSFQQDGTKLRQGRHSKQTLSWRVSALSFTCFPS